MSKNDRKPGLDNAASAGAGTRRIYFAFRVELGVVGRIVIVVQFLGDPSIAHADHIAGGKMHQPGVAALPQKVKQVDCGIHIGRKRIAQIGIEIRQARAVHNQVERFCQARLRGLVKPQARQAHIPFHDFYFFS